MTCTRRIATDQIGGPIFVVGTVPGPPPGRQHEAVFCSCAPLLDAPQSARPTPSFAVLSWRFSPVSRTELASDTYDRSKIVDTLFERRVAFASCFEAFAKAQREWEKKAAAAKKAGKRKPEKPTIELPQFVAFIRTPQCVSFRVETSGEPLEFPAVNAHLLYGEHKDERRLEFEALLEWILERAKHPDKMFYPHMVVFGDLNLDFEQPEVDRPRITKHLKSINSAELSAKRAAALNLPFLDVHPGQTEVCRTNARQDQTFDQIIFVSRDPRLPQSTANDSAGATADGYDFGCFDFADLFAQALHGRDCADLTNGGQSPAPNGRTLPRIHRRWCAGTVIGPHRFESHVVSRRPYQSTGAYPP